MATVDEIKVRITADNSDFKREMRETQGLLGRFGDMGSRAISGLATVARNSALAIGAIGTAAIGIGIKTASELQQAEIGFQSMLGSAEAAKKMMADLRDFAATTPFELAGVVDGARKLLAMGIAAEDVLPMMRSVGDAVAAMGGGAAEIDGVTRALGQIQSKGKVASQEMLQLAERGIPAWEMLAEKIGVDIPTAMKMVENGAVDAQTFMDAFSEGVTKRFGGAMDAQSKTLAGMWSTLKDQATLALADIMTPLLTQITAAMPAIQAAFANLTSVVGPALQGAFGKLPAIWEAVQPIIDAARALFGAVAEAAQRFVGALVKGLGGEEGAGSVVEAFSNVLHGLGIVIEVLGPLFEAFGFALGLAIRVIAEAINMVADLWRTLVKLKDLNLFDVGRNVIQGLIDGIMSKWNELKDAVLGIGDRIKDSFKDTFKIHSPSRVFMEYGQHMADGLALGMAGLEDVGVSATAALKNNIAQPAMSGSAPASVSQSRTVVIQTLSLPGVKDPQSFLRELDRMAEHESQFGVLSSRRATF